jgi:integrase
MPDKTALERRNKAMISLCFLTTPRISALTTARLLSIKHMQNCDAYAFLQNPKCIDTKFAKDITAFFVGSEQDIYDNVLNWQQELREHGFDDKAPLFPRITPSFDKQGKHCQILSKELIASSTTIRDIFRKAFVNNGLPYIKPHNFRHTIVRYCHEQANASQLSTALQDNLGHEKSKDTIDIYGSLSIKQRAKVLKEVSF